MVTWPYLLLQVCACKDGRDDCQLAGSCSSDKCLRLAPTVAAITAANVGRVPCTTEPNCANPVALGLPAGTYVCQSAAWFSVACNNAATPPLTLTNNTGYCVEAAPSMKASQLSNNDATFIQVSVWGQKQVSTLLMCTLTTNCVVSR
jgi:hypothetical protein